jgi:hypothetical protein
MISIGLLLGLLLNPILAGKIWEFLDDESVLSLTASFTIFGLFVGSVQWIILRRSFSKSLIWLLSSAVGFGLGTDLVLVTNRINQSGIISIIVVVLVYGGVTGYVLS